MKGKATFVASSQRMGPPRPSQCFGVGSVDWGGCGATQEHRLCLPAAAASCLAGTRAWGFIYLHLDCHGVCLPNIFPCSQARCHRQHYHSPSCSGCELDKGTLGLGHPPRGTRIGGASRESLSRLLGWPQTVLSIEVGVWCPWGNELRTVFPRAFWMGFQCPLCWGVPSPAMATLLPSKAPWFGWVGNVGPHPWCH